MRNNRELSSNMEDYLEAIVVIKKEKKVARVKDISRMMKVKTPSVTSALTTLENNDLVIHEKYGYVDLTPRGRKIAEDIRERHSMFRRFLILVLKMDPKTADEDACRLEHAISPATFKKLTKFIDFVETCPEKETPEWLKNFYYFMDTGKRRFSKKHGEILNISK